MPKYCNQCHVLGHVSTTCTKTGSDPLQPSPVDHIPLAPACPPPVRQKAPHHPPIILGPRRPPAARRNASERSSSNSHILSGATFFNSSRTSRPHNSEAPITLSEPPLSKDTPEPVVELRPSTHSPSPQDAADSLSILDNVSHPPTVHPNVPNKSTTVHPATCPMDKHKRKKVTFDMNKNYPQPNVEANTAYWEAVNRQVSVLDHARLTGSPANQTHQSTSRAVVPVPAASSPSSSNTKLLAMSPSTSDSESSLAAESPPSSSPPSPHGAQNVEFSLQPSSYHSEGEDPGTEEACFQGHFSDDMSSAKPKSSKRNKRHPDQPLKVRLRARKDRNLYP